jgi:anthranilate synthase component I
VRHEDDPLAVPALMSQAWRAAPVADLPDVFTGGWVGYTGYDTVRYMYPKKIGFDGAPRDDRELLDMHLSLYKETAVFDNVSKLVYVVKWAEIGEGLDEATLGSLYEDTVNGVRALVATVKFVPQPL